MKKLLYCVAAISAVLFAGSCQRENLEPVVNGGVTYTISLPETVQTKGESGYTSYDLYYEVYKTADPAELATATLLFEKKVVMENTNTTTVVLDLLNDQDYTILFWANKAGAKDENGQPYFNLADLRNVGINAAASNNNDRDAFCGMDQLINFDAATGKTVTLTRPFAQLNIATLVSTTAGYNVTPLNSFVRVSDIPVTYNVFDGAVSGDTSVEFAKAAVPVDKDVTVNSVDYDLVAMNYILVPEGNVTVYYEIETVNGTVNNTINNVPVKVNYRTNIVGNLLTSNATYTVDLQPGFLGGADETNVEVITDGLVKVLNTGEYNISTANGLAYASQNLFAQEGGSYVLTEDIDMSEYTALETKAGDKFWKSAEISHKTFAFDGKDHTISNLPGMFVQYTISGDLTIKNLTLNNPKIAYDVEDKSNKGVGAFFGFSDAFNKILLENCHIKGGEIEGGHWTGGLIGYASGWEEASALTIKNCSVKETTVTGKGSCGGIIGHANGGKGLVEMNTISVFSNTIKSTGTDTNKAGSVMGTVGSSSVKVTNCSAIDNEVTSNDVDNTKLWGRQGSTTGVLYVDGVLVEDFGTFTPSPTVTITNDAELAKAVEVLDVKVIKLAAGTYSENIVLTVAEEGAYQRDIKFEAVEGASPVIAGTVTLGYRNQGVAAAMWNGNITFEGITFDHANPATHSLDVQDVKSLTLKNCTIIGDGEYGLVSSRGNATGPSLIDNCTFENAAMQILGNFGTGLVINECTFNESRINVQAGNGVTVQNCTFNNTLKSANVGDSFYCVRSNSTPITVKETEINIDSELAEVATSQAKWGLLWNRGTTNWTLSNVAVTLTEAAIQQTELLVTKCTSTGTISNGLIVNGVHAGVSQNAEGVWEVDDTASGALTWLKDNNPEVFENGTVQYGTALYSYSNNGANVIMSAAGENAKTLRGLAESAVTNATVSEGIKIIGDRTFRDSPNLATVVLPQSLTELEEGAFQSCGLTSITIPGENVTLGKQSIGYLPNLETITITAKKVTVGNYCARACTKLKSVYIYSDEITFATGGSMYFTDCESNNTSGITFYVSSQSIADAVNAATPNGHAKGMQIKSIDGTTTYYTR